MQAKDYFKFAVFFLAGIGLLFQIPVGVLAVTRLGIFTPKQLAANRGYVILGIAVVAAVATPTPGPGDDDAGDGAAHRPLRAQHPAGALDRPHQAAAGRRRGRRRASTTTTSRDDEPEDDDPLAAYEDDDDEDFETDEVGVPDLTTAAEAVQEASDGR